MFKALQIVVPHKEKFAFVRKPISSPHMCAASEPHKVTGPLEQEHRLMLALSLVCVLHTLLLILVILAKITLYLDHKGGKLTPSSNVSLGSLG